MEASSGKEECQQVLVVTYALLVPGKEEDPNPSHRSRGQCQEKGGTVEKLGGLPTS